MEGTCCDDVTLKLPRDNCKVIIGKGSAPSNEVLSPALSTPPATPPATPPLPVGPKLKKTKSASKQTRCNGAPKTKGTPKKGTPSVKTPSKSGLPLPNRPAVSSRLDVLSASTVKRKKKRRRSITAFGTSFVSPPMKKHHPISTNDKYAQVRRNSVMKQKTKSSSLKSHTKPHTPSNTLPHSVQKPHWGQHAPSVHKSPYALTQSKRASAKSPKKPLRKPEPPQPHQSTPCSVPKFHPDHTPVQSHSKPVHPHSLTKSTSRSHFSNLNPKPTPTRTHSKNLHSPRSKGVPPRSHSKVAPPRSHSKVAPPRSHSKVAPRSHSKVAPPRSRSKVAPPRPHSKVAPPRSHSKTKQLSSKPRSNIASQTHSKDKPRQSHQKGKMRSYLKPHSKPHTTPAFSHSRPKQTTSHSRPKQTTSHSRPSYVPKKQQSTPNHPPSHSKTTHPRSNRKSVGPNDFKTARPGSSRKSLIPNDLETGRPRSARKSFASSTNPKPVMSEFGRAAPKSGAKHTTAADMKEERDERTIAQQRKDVGYVQTIMLQQLFINIRAKKAFEAKQQHAMQQAREATDRIVALHKSVAEKQLVIQKYGNEKLAAESLDMQLRCLDPLYRDVQNMKNKFETFLGQLLNTMHNIPTEGIRINYNKLLASFQRASCVLEMLNAKLQPNKPLMAEVAKNLENYGLIIENQIKELQKCTRLDEKNQDLVAERTFLKAIDEC